MKNSWRTIDASKMKNYMDDAKEISTEAMSFLCLVFRCIDQFTLNGEKTDEQIYNVYTELLKSKVLIAGVKQTKKHLYVRFALAGKPYRKIKLKYGTKPH